MIQLILPGEKQKIKAAESSGWPGCTIYGWNFLLQLGLRGFSGAAVKGQAPARSEKKQGLMDLRAASASRSALTRCG